MLEYPRTNWWRIVFAYEGTALRNVLARVVIMTLFTIAVQAVHDLSQLEGWLGRFGFGGLDAVGYAVLGSLLGFLIVFRMNSSNNRYWEGRSHWGLMTNAARNLARAAHAYAGPAEEVSALLAGYVLAVKEMLRGSRELEEAGLYLPPAVYRRALGFGNPPMAVVAALSEWLASRRREGVIDSVIMADLEGLVERLVDAQGGCERIQKTPLPFVYAAMIKQLILVYLITLPFVICERSGWWSPYIVMIVSFGFFGIEEASVEIEDPFGTDANCLPLDAICVTIIRDTAQLTRPARAVEAPYKGPRIPDSEAGKARIPARSVDLDNP